MARLNKRKEALQKIAFMQANRNRLKIIHYSCESFKDMPDGYSPRISSIAITDYSSAQSKSFSIHYAAEKTGIPKNTIEDHYDQLEKAMLDDFFEYVRNYSDCLYAHWNMSSHAFGFEAIYRRFRKFGGNPVEITDSRLFDLNEILKNIHGSNYVDHPRMANALSMNNIDKRNFLTGAEEAQAFINKDFNKLHMSTIAKTDAFRELLDLQFMGKLKTKLHPIQMYIDNTKESAAFKSVEIILALVGLTTIVWAAISSLRHLFE